MRRRLHAIHSGLKLWIFNKLLRPARKDKLLMGINHSFKVVNRNRLIFPRHYINQIEWHNPLKS